MIPSRIYVEILIKDSLDECWRAWFDGLEISPAEKGCTSLRGALPDYAALHGIFERIRDFNLKIISVEVQEPSSAEPWTHPPIHPPEEKIP